MDFAKLKSTTLYFLYLIILANVIIKVLANQKFENVAFGKCCSGPKDIIYLADTYYLCTGLCKERPACKAYSYNRLSWMCRLHTEECAVGTCAGFLYSRKEEWDMTSFNDCTCTEGQVCVQRENNIGFDCEIKECVLPNNPANGKILGNDVRVGRHIRCDCKDGYVPEGELTRVCQGNGTWSGNEPKCNTACPVVGSTEWGLSCYFVVTSTSLKKTFSDASAYCAVNGGHVIHVTSQAEHEYITSRLSKPSNVAATRYWVGVVRNITDGNWYLSDYTTPIVYENWASLEPKGGFDCAAYKYEETAPFKWQWVSQSCTEYPRYPLCEYDL
ncbi:uncharacterized protein LOC123539043 [Mercenaria mercenaria]|uniref:uncharacterized protein LOC123539043 n=1 Tax=Mercenaria mercenaria TaxID=6596 RepID=UPI00234E8C11|nr:uncharacterized protein LOC123539043 [Mercenaria mercenaria]